MLLCAGLNTYAQGFEGQISYKVEVKGENAALMAMMMPNSIDIFMLGKDALVRTNGGITAGMMGDIITKGAEGLSYMVVHKKKTVYKMQPSGSTSADSKPTVKEMGKEKVNGYDCTKYMVTFPKTEKGEFYQYMWCTTDINVKKPQGGTGSSGKMFLAEVNGFPVKVDQYIVAQGMEMNMEMVLDKISEKKPDASIFEIPSKYKMEDFDETKFGKM